MTLSSKEMLETAPPSAAEPLAPAAARPAAARPAAAGNGVSQLHADAVSLEVPVKIHGSRVTDVVLGTTSHTQPFEEETSTMIVFPHGSVLRMNSVVSAGQMLVLTNQKTKQDAICRVVKVRNYSNAQAYVEIEFTSRQLGYWGVQFPSDNDLPAGAMVGTTTGGTPGTMIGAKPAPAASAKRPEPPVVSSVSVKVQDIPKAPAPPPAPSSAFISIGSQEETQLAASSTTSRRSIVAPPLGMAPELPKMAIAARPAASALPASAAPAAAQPMVSEPKVSEPPVSQPPVSQPPVSQPIVLEPMAAAMQTAADSFAPSLQTPAAQLPRPSRVFGTLTGESAQASSAAEMGAHAVRPFSESSPRGLSAGGGKGRLIAACVMLGLAALAAGSWYLWQRPSGSDLSQPQPAPSASASTSTPAASFGSPPAAAETQGALPNSQTPQTGTDIPGPERTAGKFSEAPLQNPSRDAVDSPAAISKPKSQPMGNIGMAVIGAHPVTRHTTAREAAAPDLAAVTAPSGISLPGAAAATSPDLAPPPAAIPVGGNLIPARVLRSKPPIYPPTAVQSGIQGDVVIKAQVDESGNTAGMQVLSGQAILRQAALDALRTWKYQPAKLNGQSVASQVTVTIQFRK